MVRREMLQEPITIVCWWWKTQAAHQKYRSADVVRLKEMLNQNCSIPHRFLCMTNAPEDLDGGIETERLDQRYIDWGWHYVKLFAFSEEMKAIAGPHALFLDLDVAIISDIAPLLVDRSPFRIASLFRSSSEQIFYDALRLTWRRRNIYNSSVIYMQTGAFSFVWDEFDIDAAHAAKARLALTGTDQAWIEHRLGRGMPVFGPRQGVFKLRRLRGSGRVRVPPSARIVFYPGNKDGRTMEEHYRYLLGSG